MMTMQEYAKTKHTFPYVVDVSQGKAHIIYFGAQHSHDPKDKQFVFMRQLMQILKPDEVLNEDITPEPHDTLAESIQYDGERGALAFWTKKDGIPLKSIDFDWRDEIRKLPVTIRGSTIKMFYFLRGLQEDMNRPGRKMTKATDELATQELQMLDKEGVGWPPRDVHEVDLVWKGLGIPGDWRQPKASWVSPDGKTPLNTISALINRNRDQHMVDVLKEELHAGKKVFVVVGGTHVIMQQGAIPGNVERIK